MNILILGSGGREHALAHALSKSPLTKKLSVAPGNAGTQLQATNVDLDILDFTAIGKWCIDNMIDMLVVGPEAPLVKGIYNYFQEDENLNHINVIGPSKEAALLEGSKEFAKEFMIKHHIPTARYKSFTKESLKSGMAFIDTLAPPYVLKADGLAGGKGVLIIPDADTAKESLEDMLVGGKFGTASNKVVIEEFLEGIEMSVFVLTDGDSYKILPTAKDYKRIGENDTGLNTGGMGAVSPVPFATTQLIEKVEERIIKPTITGFKSDKLTYKGFVFIGLMIVNSEPYVIEYNVRLGDPETEVVLPRISSDLASHLNSLKDSNLNGETLDIDSRAATTVMCVSGGYPEAYDKGYEITGLNNIKDATVYHAGTAIKDDKIVTNGGRVLAVTAYGTDFNEALKKSYHNAAQLHYNRIYYRKDIGKDL